MLNNEEMILDFYFQNQMLRKKVLQNKIQIFIKLFYQTFVDNIMKKLFFKDCYMFTPSEYKSSAINLCEHIQVKIQSNEVLPVLCVLYLSAITNYFQKQLNSI